MCEDGFSPAGAGAKIAVVGWQLKGSGVDENAVVGVHRFRICKSFLAPLMPVQFFVPYTVAHVCVPFDGCPGLRAFDGCPGLRRPRDKDGKDLYSDGVRLSTLVRYFKRNSSTDNMGKTLWIIR